MPGCLTASGCGSATLRPGALRRPRPGFRPTPAPARPEIWVKNPGTRPRSLPAPTVSPHTHSLSPWVPPPSCVPSPVSPPARPKRKETPVGCPSPCRGRELAREKAACFSRSWGKSFSPQTAVRPRIRKPPGHKQPPVPSFRHHLTAAPAAQPLLSWAPPRGCRGAATS